MVTAAVGDGDVEADEGEEEEGGGGVENTRPVARAMMRDARG